MQAGYVGDDVESILYKLLQTANFQVELAQQVGGCSACVPPVYCRLWGFVLCA